MKDRETAQAHGLETVGERLTRLRIKKTLCLGTEREMSSERILLLMSDKQITDMFNENADVQYILLDSQGR